MKNIILIILLGFILSHSVLAEEITPVAELTRGAKVTVQGVVSRIPDDDEFRLRDSTGSVLVYIGWKNKMPVKVGDTVLVRGVVDDDLKTQFRPEINATKITRKDGTGIDLKKRATKAQKSVAPKTSVSVMDFTPIGELERGMSAVIKGKVTRILDLDEFRIEDSTGSIRVYIGWKNSLVSSLGEELIVKGVVDNDLMSFFRPEFYASEIKRQDGTVLKLQ